MAIVSVNQRFDGEQTSSSKSPKGEFSESQTIEYQVVSDNHLDGTDKAKRANVGGVHIPQEGSTVAVNGRVYLVTKVDAKRSKDSPFVYDVVVTASIQSESPTDTAKFNVTISVDGLDYSDVVTEDVVTTDPIANSAGQPFPEGITEEYADEEITLAFSCKNVDLSSIAACRKKINSASVTFTANGLNKTCAAKTLKLQKARYSCTVPAVLAAVSGVVVTWDIEYVFHYRADTWTRQIVDRGFYKLSGTELVRILDKNFKPIESVSFLDGSGDKLTRGVPVIRLPFETIAQSDFSTLVGGL